MEKHIGKERNQTEPFVYNRKKPPECEDYVKDNVFAIDFDEKTVRVARTLNLIAGDGRTNVMYLNTLDYERWQDSTSKDEWQDVYHDGWSGIRKLRSIKEENRDFNFDIVMANPPFAGDIKESRIITKYELGKNSKGKYQTSVGRDILFIERNLSFLKPGGRMAVVLPQGRFNNSTDKYIRDYIVERCRILAVVGLNVNVFKPHTGTKTSVLFVQKWDEKLCPKKEDYNIFFATMQKTSKDSSGEKIFIKDDYVDYNYFEGTKRKNVTMLKNDFIAKFGADFDALRLYRYQDKDEQTINGKQYKDLLLQGKDKVKGYNPYATVEEYQKPKLDSNGHLIVDHDLFNHEGLTKDGIVEAFIEFAKKEGLSFF